jgi:2-polyprenyl-3-methyl-5-hydroxy-6-metoxy-1,4-benzoquinol methylase
MSLNEKDIAYFNGGMAENIKFWSRLGGKPDLNGKTVLDVGCGHGCLCINMAASGAKKVIGIDLDSEYIAFAKENSATNYSQYTGVVEFHKIDLKDYDKKIQFDYIVSKDSFEHILDLSEMLEEIKLRIKQGGILFTGFGPLYNDFYGDHKRTQSIIPWGHVLFTDEKIIKRLNKKRYPPIHSITDLGINQLSLADYRRIFKNSGMEIIFFQVNVSNNPILKLFNIIARIFPFLEEYFAHNIYAIFKKTL